MSRASRAKTTRQRRPLHCRNGFKYHNSLRLYGGRWSRTFVSPGRFGNAKYLQYEFGGYGKPKAVTHTGRGRYSLRRLHQMIERQERRRRRAA